MGQHFAATDKYEALYCSVNGILSAATYVNTTMVIYTSPSLNQTTGSFSFKVTNDDGLHYSSGFVNILYYAVV